MIGGAKPPQYPRWVSFTLSLTCDEPAPSQDDRRSLRWHQGREQPCARRGTKAWKSSRGWLRSLQTEAAGNRESNNPSAGRRNGPGRPGTTAVVSFLRRKLKRKDLIRWQSDISPGPGAGVRQGHDSIHVYAVACLLGLVCREVRRLPESVCGSRIARHRPSPLHNFSSKKPAVRRARQSCHVL